MFDRFLHRVSYHQPLKPPHEQSYNASHVHWICSRIIQLCLYGAVFLVPLFSLPWTIEPYDINKQALLIFFAFIGSVAWIIRSFQEKRLVLPRHWVHFSVLLFGFVLLVSSIFSIDRFASFLGGGGHEAQSVFTLGACIVLYYLFVLEIKSTKEVYDVLLAFLVSSFILSISSLIRLFLISRPDFLQSNALTPVGSYFSLAIFCTIPLFIASAVTFHGRRNTICILGRPTLIGKVARIFLWIIQAVNLVLLAFVDLWVSWVLLFIGTFVLVILGILHTRKIGHPTRMIMPTILVGVSFVFLLIKSPFNFSLPMEVFPSSVASWNIDRIALSHYPVFGSGPATWTYLYSSFHQVAVNLSPFWQTRFHVASSAFLTMLPTVGIIGSLAWLLILFSVLFKGGLHLVQEKQDDVWHASIVVFVSWFSLSLASFLYPASISLVWMFWLFTALIGCMITRRLFIFSLKESSYRVVIRIMFVFIGGIVGLWMFFVAGQRWIGNIFFASAIHTQQGGQPLNIVIKKIMHAHLIAPREDLYLRHLSQALLARGFQSLQNQTQQTQKILEIAQRDFTDAGLYAVRATALASAVVENWENAGSVYESLAPFVKGADSRAIVLYSSALEREPTNSGIMDEIARVYIFQVDRDRSLLDVRDVKVRTDAKRVRAERLKSARTMLERAIAIKPDYLPARYHLSQVSERDGKMYEAIQALVGVLKERNRDVGIAFELAILFARAEQREQAIALLQQITQIDPGNANARWYLAALLQGSKRYDLARTQLQKLIQLLPENLAVRERLVLLEKEAKLLRISSKMLPEPLR